MDDHELEHRLRGLRQTLANRGFQEWSFSAVMRGEVHKRTSGRAPSWKWPRIYRGALVALVASLLVITFVKLGQIVPKPASAITVQQNEVDMDGRAPFELVRLSRVYPEEGAEPAYVTTVWEGEEASKRLIYNQGLEAGSSPLSLQALALPGSTKQLVLISTLSPEGGQLYDLMSFDGQRVRSYRGGEKASTGMDDQLVPRRLVDAGSDLTGLPAIVWVVWTRMDQGEVRFFPASEMVINEGESLLILGNQNGYDLSKPELLPDGVLEPQDLGFIAARPGQTLLKLVPAEYPWHTGELKVKVLGNVREELR
ncbi:MAG: hypothetical protein ACYCX4_14845 [Bacillota bacterium]